MSEATTAPTVYVLWWRLARGRKWAAVFRGTKEACAAEESRLIVDERWPGDFYPAAEGRRP